MNYSLAKHSEIRAAIVAELTGLTDIPGGCFNARVKPFESEDVDTDFPVATVFTGNDSAEYSADDANLRRDYDVQVVIVSKGYDITDDNLGSAGESFIGRADLAQKAVENALTQFRYTLGALVYRLKYLRTSAVIDEDGEYYTDVRILEYTAHSVEKVVGANV